MLVMWLSLEVLLLLFNNSPGQSILTNTRPTSLCTVLLMPSSNGDKKALNYTVLGMKKMSKYHRRLDELRCLTTTLIHKNYIVFPIRIEHSTYRIRGEPSNHSHRIGAMLVAEDFSSFPDGECLSLMEESVLFPFYELTF